MSELDQLVKRRGILKGQITKLVTYSERCNGDTPYDDMKVRVDKLNEHYRDFVLIEDSIFSVEANTQSDMTSIDESYYTALARFQRFMRAKINMPVASPNESSLNASFSANAAADFKLPRLSLPTFSGNGREWQSFYDLFKATVHDNVNLSPAQKFQYLKGQLRGQAEQLVRHLRVDDANYLEAFQRLMKRYDKKRQIVNEFIELFLGQSDAIKNSAESISRMFDTCDEVIRGLKALGTNAESRDCWLVYIGESKLDEISLQLWRQHTSENDFPTFDDFLNFLTKRMDSLVGTRPTQKEKPQAKVATKYVSNAKSLHVKPLPTCSLCPGQEHRMCDCPKFLAMEIDKRRDYIKQNSRCFNCLGEYHNVRRCGIRHTCHKCHKKHNTLLHLDFEPAPSSSRTPLSHQNNSQDSANFCLMPSPPKREPSQQPIETLHSIPSPNLDAILPTALIEVRDKFGIWQTCRALLDSASTRSFITESCLRRLNLPRINARVNIGTLNGGTAGTSKGLANLQFRSRFNHAIVMDLNTYIIPKITTCLPPKKIDLTHLKYLKDLPLADPTYSIPGKIDCLIGCDRFLLLLTEGQIIKDDNQPTAQRTILGWILGGNYINADENEVCPIPSTFLSTDLEHNIDETLRKFWEIEEIPSTNELTPDEQKCVSHFEDTFRREKDGKFCVSLPINTDVENLGDSFGQALKRFYSLERKFDRDESFKKMYHDFMHEYETLGHMELIPYDEIDKPAHSIFYLPHHGIFKEASSTTKLRVVFDASAKSTSLKSLNDRCLVGPTIQQSLIEILMRFRKYRYVFSADIEKMYRQIWIKKPDTDLQRIIWRESPLAPIRHYRLKTVTYGTAPASYLATQCVHKLAELHELEYPKAAKIYKTDFYMDDLMSGANTLEDAAELQDQAIALSRRGGFHLRKWSANHVNLLKKIPKQDQEVSPREITEENKMISVLGIKYTLQTDAFTFKVNLPNDYLVTKRTVLSESSRVFDPMGWLSPVIVAIKILMQKLWYLKLDWDEELPDDTQMVWSDIRNELHSLENLSIPRWLSSTTEIMLCGFADASEDAYAAVIYTRTIQNGKAETTLIASKTRVAPLKTITIPKLELCAAVLLTRLLKVVVKSLSLEKDPAILLWSDSTTVLDWLASPPVRRNIFVANRVREILETTDTTHWNYVPTKQNPADCASRGVAPDEIQKMTSWWKGPSWLQETPLKIPSRRKPKESDSKSKTLTTISSPVADTTHSSVFVKSSIIVTELSTRFSSYRELKRVLTWILRSVHNVRSKDKRRGPLQVQELKESECVIVKEMQMACFARDVMLLTQNRTLDKNSKIRFLNPFLDEHKILRVGGRLSNASVSLDVRHPIILDGSNRVTEMIAKEAHEKYLHAGVTSLMSILSQRYSIIRCKNLVRRVIHQCLMCFRQKKTTQSQLMGQLPAARVNLVRAFMQTSVDYAGPYHIKAHPGRGAKTSKSYIAIFTCMATKAIHIELVTDMSTDTFIAAMKRFQSRRGICSDIYSDNGSNFIGAANELERLHQILTNDLTKDEIVNWATNNGTRWHFVPPRSPNFNGLCEAAVKSTKYHLKRILGDTRVTYEELITLLVQIEAVLNSRPLCDIKDETYCALTPAHFLIGQPLTLQPEPDLKHLKMSHLSRWQHAQQMFQHFWTRWNQEYLTSLNAMSKWQKKEPNMKVGDLVLIRDEKQPPGQWALGRIQEVHLGSDNLVRVVTLRTASGILKRPITKIAVLPNFDSPCESTGAICLVKDSPMKSETSIISIDSSTSSPSSFTSSPSSSASPEATS